MGGSGKWLKSLISSKKSSPNDREKTGSEKSKKKWRLWRNTAEGMGSSTRGMTKKRNEVVSDKSDTVSKDAFTAAVAAVVRAPPKGFLLIKQEWAAIRIQALFRGFLARRALRALRAVVRIQAIFRGRQVRKQAAVTLRCMQALVRVQARVKARSVSLSPDRKHTQGNALKQAERGWCDIPGSVDEVKAKLQIRQEAAIKRERAMAYSLSTQQSKMSASPNSRFKPMSPLKHDNLDSRSLLERWMATKPWENRLKSERYFDSPDRTPLSRKSDNFLLPRARKNAVTTRVSLKPPVTSLSAPSSLSSSSAISSECMYDESPLSASCTSPEEKSVPKPSFMNFTESTKAKQKTCKCSSLIGDARSTSGCDPSVNFWRDCYATPQRASYQRRYSRR
ncbi:LOW QUALITY PROTEIN: protein IQ-DOMAIN 8-like [Prosopis cineraria]|uniref:LOW QUALITY PROTEIN: protein IQ-DOMAIN 8-like n=1 Tax=Prosopis cineraria TaxID=364024 RepID=UPI00240F2CB7|nr:LOW QUALITY PROTEIN: protein IQ-DOMAIN 8-like [Prosopis cineraria]